MKNYISDGKKLINAEYDDIPELGDTIDGMRVLSVDQKNSEEYAVFLLEPNTRVMCYVFDEIFIIGKTDGFENITDAIEAWKSEEI